MSTEEDKVNSGALGTLIAILTIAVVGVALALTALVRQEQDAGTIQPEIAGPYEEALRNQRSELTKPAAWVDKGEGIVSLPVDRAMSVVTAKLKENPEWATPAPPAVDGGADAAAQAVDAGAAETDGGATPQTEAGTDEPKEAPEGVAPEAPAPPPQDPQPTAPTPPAPQPKAPQPKAPQPKPPGGSAPTTPDDGNPY